MKITKRVKAVEDSLGFDSEVLKSLTGPEEIGKYIQPFVKDFKYYWMFNDGDSLDLKVYNRAKAFDMMEDRVSSGADFYSDNDFGYDDDEKTFEKNTGIPYEPDSFKALTSANTYNQGYLYPVDLNLVCFEVQGRYFMEIRIHQGGDDGVNYTGGYYYERGSEQELLEEFNEIMDGSHTIEFKFIDGTSLSLCGQQNSDVDYYQVGDIKGYDTKQPNLYDSEAPNSKGGIAVEVGSIANQYESKWQDMDDLMNAMLPEGTTLY